MIQFVFLNHHGSCEEVARCMRGSGDFSEVAWFEHCWEGLGKDRWFQIDKHCDMTYLWGNLFSHSFCFLLVF